MYIKTTMMYYLVVEWLPSNPPPDSQRCEDMEEKDLLYTTGENVKLAQT